MLRLWGFSFLIIFSSSVWAQQGNKELKLQFDKLTHYVDRLAEALLERDITGKMWETYVKEIEVKHAGLVDGFDRQAGRNFKQVYEFVSWPHLLVLRIKALKQDDSRDWVMAQLLYLSTSSNYLVSLPHPNGEAAKIAQSLNHKVTKALERYESKKAGLNATKAAVGVLIHDLATYLNEYKPIFKVKFRAVYRAFFLLKLRSERMLEVISPPTRESKIKLLRSYHKILKRLKGIIP